MAEMRRVQLREDHNSRKNGSTFNYENRTYTLNGSRPLEVPLHVANAWKAADANIVIMPER